MLTPSAIQHAATLTMNHMAFGVVEMFANVQSV
jgi:hypothetical protein